MCILYCDKCGMIINLSSLYEKWRAPSNNPVIYYSTTSALPDLCHTIMDSVIIVFVKYWRIEASTLPQYIWFSPLALCSHSELWGVWGGIDMASGNNVSSATWCLQGLCVGWFTIFCNLLTLRCSELYLKFLTLCCHILWRLLTFTAHIFCCLLL